MTATISNMMDKKDYGGVVNYFKTLNQYGPDQLALLIDTIEQMPPEIYECYRALQDIFRREVKAMRGRDREGWGESMEYIIRQGCATGTLLEEKYESFLNKNIWR